MKSPALVLSRRYRDISGFSVATDHHDAKSRLHIFQCMQSLTFSNFMSTVNVIMLLTRMGKFMYMQAWLTNSIMICMLALHVTTLNHCHIVAMGMTLFQLPNSLILEVLSIKHWRQSAFAETLLTVRHSRDARQRRASMLVLYVCIV